MPTPELQVLKPVDPSISNPDDYEIFALDDAQVLYESNGRPASLLSAYADTPMRVEGTLQPPTRAQLKCLLKRPYRQVELAVRNVTRFSYGQMTDGELAVWALGDAGWFEIRPAPRYEGIYQDMIEAIELLYLITDIHMEPRKKGGGPSAQLIFQEYAEDERYPCNDPVLAAQIFHKHHEFLMMCFLNRAQGVAWSNTPIYQYFRRQYPKTFETAKARIEGRYEQVKQLTRTTEPSPTVTASKHRASRGKAQVQKDAAAPKKDDNWWEAAALFEFMSKCVNQRIIRPGHGKMTVDRVARLMVKRYEIAEVDTAKNVLLVHGQNLCYMMDRPRRKDQQFFSNEPLYHELSTGHDLPAAEIRRAEAVELRVRRDHVSLKEDEVESDSVDDSSEDVIVTPRRRPDGRKKKGRLSVLRPKSAKYSGKGKGVKRDTGKGKRPSIEETSSENGHDDGSSVGAKPEAATSSASDIEADTPTQALSPSREKRKFNKTDDASDIEEKTRRKRMASTSLGPGSPPLSSNSDETEQSAETGAAVPIPLRYRPLNIPPTTVKPPVPLTKPTIAPPIVSTPLPTYESNGPRDSWICTFDGCSQRIYGASKELGRQLITEHLEDHVKGRHAVVGILLREEEKLRLPVNNLLKKIREMSESQAPLFPTSSLDTATTVTAMQSRPIERSL